MTPRLEARRLTKTLLSGGKPLTILDEIDLEIQPASSVAILGPSGSGKSTLLGLLAGLDRPSSGSVLFDGAPIHDRNEDELAIWRRDNLGFVFQNFQLLGHLTAEENVMLPLELRRRGDARQRARDLMQRVGLGDRGHHYPVQLSGGEQQRVAIARAFAGRPSVLLADEPTGNLDSKTGATIIELLSDLQQRHDATLVLVTHDPAVAAHAGRRVTLVDGRMVAEEG